MTARKPTPKKPAPKTPTPEQMRMMIEQERVRFVSLEIRDALKYAEIIESYVADLKKIGPNPFKI